MELVLILLLVLLVIVTLLLTGMRIGLAIALAGLLGLVFLLRPAQPEVAGELFWNASKSYYLTSLPLFVFMAEILLAGGIAQRAYQAAVDWLGPVPGGAAHSTIAASVGFAAMCGSSVASAAALGAMVAPQLTEQGYNRRLVFGTIAAGGTLGILIPPSIALIIYGALAGQSIGHLFMAGVVPGLLMAFLFSVTVFIWSLIFPSHAPRSPAAPLRQKFRSLVALVPAIMVIGLVLGGIYAGYFSPTESAGFGSCLALLITIFNRTFSWRMLLRSARSAVETTSMIIVIIAAASLLTYVLGMLRLPGLLAQAVAASGLPAEVILVVMAILYILLGCVIESVSLVVLTVPIILPILKVLGVDLIWFGIFIVIVVEIALLTPPVGLNLYVLQRIPAGQSLNDIIIGSAPFVGTLIVGLIILMIWPELATWLPSRMQ